MALEAIWSGVGIIADGHEFVHRYGNTVALTDDQVLVVAQDEPLKSAAKIKAWLKTRKKAAPRSTITFSDYVTLNENIYANLLEV